MFIHTDFGNVDSINIFFDVKFDFAPDTIFLRRSRTQFGNVWAKNEDEIIKKLSSFEESDIEIIVTIFE